MIHRENPVKATIKRIKVGTKCQEINGWQDFSERHSMRGTFGFFNYSEEKPYFFQCVENGSVYHVSWLEFERKENDLFDF